MAHIAKVVLSTPCSLVLRESRSNEKLSMIVPKKVCERSVDAVTSSPKAPESSLRSTNQSSPLESISDTTSHDRTERCGPTPVSDSENQATVSPELDIRDRDTRTPSPPPPKRRRYERRNSKVSHMFFVHSSSSSSTPSPEPLIREEDLYEETPKETPSDQQSSFPMAA